MDLDQPNLQSVYPDKSAIREKIVAQRDAIPPEQRMAWSQTICEHAVRRPEFQAAKVVHCFLSMRSEIDTRYLIQHCFANGKRVAIPHFVRNRDATPCLEITTLDESAFSVTPFGLRLPHDRRSVSPELIDLTFVPLLAFTQEISFLSRIEAQPNSSIMNRIYHRIGYGAGYYDRFLAKLRPDAARIGLAFAIQQVAGFDIQPHDLPLDWVITERQM